MERFNKLEVATVRLVVELQVSFSDAVQAKRHRRNCLHGDTGETGSDAIIVALGSGDANDTASGTASCSWICFNGTVTERLSDSCWVSTGVNGFFGTMTRLPHAHRAMERGVHGEHVRWI